MMTGETVDKIDGAMSRGCDIRTLLILGLADHQLLLPEIPI